MEKKNSDQIDPPDNLKKVNDSGITRNEKEPEEPYDSMFILEEDALQIEEDDDSDFSKYENDDFVERLNQQNEEMEEGDPLDFLDNPYLGDETFEDMELDIPGSELDDEMENIGSEDEENNYYSLGGDNHEDLEEQQFEEDF